MCVISNLNPVNDRDGDGYAFADDCNDCHFGINPGAIEKPGNDIDDDCDGVSAPVPVYVGPVTELTVYPNPSDGNINIAGHDLDDYELKLVNSLGQVCLKQEVTPTINLSHLPSGAYFLIIENSNKTRVHLEQIILSTGHRSIGRNH